jgi:A/G-specific adenine glycosylase
VGGCQSVPAALWCIMLNSTSQHQSDPQSHMPARLDHRAVLKWYDKNARLLPWRISPLERKAGVLPDPYRVWLSEIMLQQTGTVTVKSYFSRFLQNWPCVHQLAAAPLEDVLRNWAGLGYYARARNLHACAKRISGEYSGSFPQSSAILATLPGIGPYTSAAIAAICFDERIGVVDGNVERVVARILALETPPKLAKPLVRSFVQEAVPKRAGDFAQGLMDLGATICTPRAANCLSCPLQTGCQGNGSENPTRFPVAAPRKARPDRFGHAFVFRARDGAVFLVKRPQKGLLAQMSAPPVSHWGDEEKPVQFRATGGRGGKWCMCLPTSACSCTSGS